MNKKIAAFIMALALSISMGSAMTAGAVEDTPGTITPFRYEDISRISPGLSVSGTTATYRLTVRGSNSVTSLSATLQLQRYVGGAWSNYGTSWTASSDTGYLYTTGTKTVDSGATYRLKVTVTPYINGVAGTSETATS